MEVVFLENDVSKILNVVQLEYYKDSVYGLNCTPIMWVLNGPILYVKSDEKVCLISMAIHCASWEEVGIRAIVQILASAWDKVFKF